LFGTIAITDYDWYRTLFAMGGLDEVNFWLPSSRRGFRAEHYSPFFFKLRHPHNAIVGFGLFDRYIPLADWLAWECFEERNGCESFQAMSERIRRIREGYGYVEEGGSNEIGCVLVAQPVFFPRDLWIPQPADWHARTQRSQKYDLAIGEGRRIWLECQNRARAHLHKHFVEPVPDSPEATVQFLYRLAKQRVGQGTFRVNVSDAYDWACSVTHEHSLPALDAAHIRPVAKDGPNDVANGLLLRADLHRLFDHGYLTVTPDLHLEVSPRLRDDYSNGKSYYPHDRTLIHVPSDPALRPAPEFLRWHNECCFRA